MNLSLENLLIITGSSIAFIGTCSFLWFICRDCQVERIRKNTAMTDVLLIENVEV